MYVIYIYIHMSWAGLASLDFPYCTETKTGIRRFVLYIGPEEARFHVEHVRIQ
jgi:hypothetical protein